jgi:4'-phosphopantetheinyl transferase
VTRPARGPQPEPVSLDHLSAGPAAPRLAAGEIHVWAIDLEPGAGRLTEIGAVLCGEERQRAARFHFPVHRDRFTAGRGALRRILALYTGEAPADLVFTYGERGKPELPSAADLYFNLSHSSGLGLLGVTRCGRVGVDVERLKPATDFLSLSRRFFSAAEHERLLGLPEQLRLEGFFNAWTRKEAYVKAVGQGLALGLDEFDVSLAPGEPARFLTFRDPRWDLARWRLYDLPPAPGFAGAVALEGRAQRVRLWRWLGAAPGPGPAERGGAEVGGE